VVQDPKVELEAEARQDDAELVRQIAAVPAGQAAAAEGELYRRLAPRVRLYGLRHLRDEQLAADLTQDVLLTVFRALREGRLREPEKLVSFVLGTCRVTVLDLRRNALRRQELLEEFRAEFPIAAPAPAPALDGAQLTRCLETLPERDRSIIVMSFYNEQNATEVAESLGITQQNVRVIRHRALGRLRHCMGSGKANL
jgi:RNA polymerase sigma-70 factor (ECF subfamily)